MHFFMSRCIALAAHGRGRVAPNPMVGAVIVADGVIIGEGYHRCFGEPHAEVNAIASVKEPSLLQRSTLYVNLEPCSHDGKTAPCAELIIRKQIPRVVVACSDPYPEVAGRGITMLRDAGVHVTVGIMEREAAALNRFFMTAHRHHRPYIILKWAQSEDGFIDRHRKDVSERPTQFSTPVTRMMAHKLRAEVQAIMVGTNTALLDDPSLLVRYWAGRSPVRLLIDRRLRVPPEYRLFDGRQTTLVVTEQDAASRMARCFQEKKNVKYIKMDEAGFQLHDLATILYENGLHSLLVEGGARLHRSFIEKNLWDEILVETAPIRLGEGVKAAALPVGDNIQLADKQLFKSTVSDVEKPTVMEWFVNRTV